MNPSVIGKLGAVCLLILGLFPAKTVFAEETLPLQYRDFREGLEQARKHDLPLLLHFYADWCGPCQQMDRNVFASPQLERSLGGKLILVKVNGDVSPDLVKMYQVASYPADLFIDPQGRILSSSTGVATLNDYIASALRVERRYQQSQKLLQTRQESGNSPVPYSSMIIRLGEPEQFPETLKSVEKPLEPQAEQQRDRELAGLDAQDKKPKVVFVALDGFCAVRLKQNREWIKGEAVHTYEYQQQEYRFTGKAELEMFAQSPEEYAPKLLGCDPVIMWEKDRAMPGSTAFAAYYNTELFLFTSEENREMFRIDPERYIQMRHVLIPRNVEATLIR